MLLQFPATGDATFRMPPVAPVPEAQLPSLPESAGTTIPAGNRDDSEVSATESLSRVEEAPSSDAHILELATQQTIAEIIESHRKAAPELPHLSPLDLARVTILNSVDEIRRAVTPPNLTLLDRST